MRGRRSPAFSPLGRVGWTLIAVGLLGEIFYHLVPLIIALRWPPMVTAFGEFGHTLIPLGMTIVVFAVLLEYQKQKRG